MTEEEKDTTHSPSLETPTSVETTEDESASTEAPEDKLKKQGVQETANKVSPEEPSLEVEDKDLFYRMMEVGTFYGRSKSKTNPLSKKYILTTRSGYEVIDIQQAIGHLKEACEVLKKIVSDDGLVLFVGTSPAAKRIIKNMAMRLEFPYVTERWLGGTLTNFKTITDRINYFKKLKDDKSAGRLDKYTKKEQLRIDKELVKLERLFGGIEKLDKLPQLMFIADLTENEYAAREAKQYRIPIIALLNTDADSKLVDYPIPANDRNPKSIELLMEYVEQAANEGKQQAVLKKEAQAQSNTEDNAEKNGEGKTKEEKVPTSEGKQSSGEVGGK